jgi:hypothetical protein
MPKTQSTHDAIIVQDELRKRLGHEQVHVKTYGSHLLIQLEVDEERDTVARITQIDANTFGAAFRTHSGRWEPLFEQGSLKEMITLVIEELGPYLTLDNY